MIQFIMQMRRGELGTTPRQRRLLQSFAWGLLQIGAKYCYDPLLKASQPSRSSASARKGLDVLRARTEKLLRQEFHLSLYMLCYPSDEMTLVAVRLLEKRRLSDTERKNALRTLRMCDEYVECFDEFEKGWHPLAPLLAKLRELSSYYVRHIVDQAMQHISSYTELKKRWDVADAAWKEQKLAWEAAHPDYMRVLPRLQEFERSAGQFPRRQHHSALLKFVQAQPDFATWSGGELALASTNTRTSKRGKKSKSGVESLAELHRTYWRELRVFEEPPTFTLPDAFLHPRNIVFANPRTNPSGYTSVSLPGKKGELGSITLRLLDVTADGVCQEKLESLRFRCDDRLAGLRSIPNAPETLEQWDRRLHCWRKVQLGGVRLTFSDVKHEVAGHKRQIKSAAVYLEFVLRSADEGEKVETPKTPDGIYCTVRPRLRDGCYVVLSKVEAGKVSVLRAKNISLEHFPQPTLKEIVRHQRALSRRKSLSGKPVAGEKSNRELQAHVTNSGNDRTKKLADAVLDFALNSERAANKDGTVYPRAQVLVVQDLTGFSPSFRQSAAENRALTTYSRGRLIERITQGASYYDLRTVTVDGFGSGETCSRCAGLGCRFNMRTKDGELDPDFGKQGHRFICAACNYEADADHNAALNLLRLTLDRSWVRQYRKYVKLSQTDRRQDWESRLATVKPVLVARYSPVSVAV